MPRDFRICKKLVTWVSLKKQNSFISNVVIPSYTYTFPLGPTVTKKTGRKKIYI